VTASFEFHFHPFLLSAKPKIGGRICGSEWEKYGFIGLRIGLAEVMKGEIHGERNQGESKTRQGLALVVCSSQQQKRATLGPDDGGKFSIQLMDGLTHGLGNTFSFSPTPFIAFSPPWEGRRRPGPEMGMLMILLGTLFAFYSAVTEGMFNVWICHSAGGICSGHGGAELQATCKKGVDKGIW
jgi:hypothetical protein